MPLYLALALFAFFAFFPLYWMVITSVTPGDAIFSFPPSFLPREITADHFFAFFENPRLIRFTLNSLIVATATSVGSVVVSSFAAYSFSKFRYRGRKSLMYLVLSAQMFPQALLLITLYVMFNALGLLNTYLGIILAFTTFTLPLCTWMLKNYFDNIPTELIEAAKVDGASQWTIMRRVLFPLALPGLAATGLFSFIRGWNDFIFALTLAGSQRQTLPPGLVLTYLSEFQSASAWAEVMAASLLVSMPVAVAFMVMQRFFIEGLTGGGVKG